METKSYFKVHFSRPLTCRATLQLPLILFSEKKKKKKFVLVKFAKGGKKKCLNSNLQHFAVTFRKVVGTK